jgi:bisphosphoglycerate-dependent phosphoglycerate mutase
VNRFLPYWKDSIVPSLQLKKKYYHLCSR